MAKRLAAIVAVVMVAALAWTGVAVAADGDDNGGGSNPVGRVVEGVTAGGTAGSNGGTGSNPVAGAVGNAASSLPSTPSGLPSTPTSLPTSANCAGIPVGPICIPTGLPTPTSGSTGGSGANTVIEYRPYPIYEFDGNKYGHRSYGKYWDSGCGCDRYASPTYVPTTVVATQVKSVPKGGVDTGDGSFR